MSKKKLSPEQRKELLSTLKARTEKLWSLNEMETTGGEPDVVAPIAVGIQ